MLTSVPVAAGVVWFRLFRAMFRDGMNEHFIVVPPTDVSVSRLPLFRARIETTVGVVMVSAAPFAVGAVVPVGVAGVN